MGVWNGVSDNDGSGDSGVDNDNNYDGSNKSWQ
jgi:hypothetical protein